MTFRRPHQVVRRAKHWLTSAYSTAQEMAPGVKKGVEALRRGYAAAAPMIDEYGGRRASDFHKAAKKGFDTYDSLERAAGQADGVVRAMRS
jgi:hypothetical protein